MLLKLNFMSLLIKLKFISLFIKFTRNVYLKISNPTQSLGLKKALKIDSNERVDTVETFPMYVEFCLLFRKFEKRSTPVVSASGKKRDCHDKIEK